MFEFKRIESQTLHSETSANKQETEMKIREKHAQNDVEFMLRIN